MKFMLLAFAILLTSKALAERPARTAKWLQENRDAKGCIPLLQLVDAAVEEKKCPKNVSLNVSPSPVGIFANDSSAEGRKLCCYKWQKAGQR
jgi:hypothetical protein